MSRLGRSAGRALLPSAALLLCACQATHPRSPRERAIAAAARPILEMDPNAVWTDAFNRLVELNPDSVVFLAEHPTMTRRCAPDNLRALLHSALLRMLILPRDAPKLSMSCLETTLGVLHFEPRASMHRIGTVHRPAGPLPRRWHDLFPADFDHRVTVHIDADLDRLALRLWWQRHRDRIGAYVVTEPLRPQVAWLWPVLARRYADQWRYSPAPGAVLCAQPRPAQTLPGALVRVESSRYDLVRATCILLGRHEDAMVQDRLIELVGNRSDVVSHNARFSLGFAADARIRALIERHRSDPARERPPSESANDSRVIKT